jgi:hypothetical protein
MVNLDYEWGIKYTLNRSNIENAVGLGASARNKLFAYM